MSGDGPGPNAVTRDGPVDSTPGYRAAVGSQGGGGARGGGGRGGGRRRKGGRRERAMVPDAEFTSYYGRPVVKASPWERDIPIYLFLGGLAGGSSLLGAGADLSGRQVTRKASRLTALVAVAGSGAFLVNDLGRPERFYNMLRVAKPTSPMSVGTWILTAYGPFAGLAGLVELSDHLPAGLRGSVPVRLLRLLGRPAGLAAAVMAPALASYTAVLLADTATPTWHDAWQELPVVFVASAAAASGGAGMLLAPLTESGPARRLAIGGAVLDLVAVDRMEKRMGLTAEPLHEGTPGRYMRAAKALTTVGAIGALLGGRRSRTVAGLSGAALMAGSWCLRFGVFEAGQESAKDPKYTVVPQRARVEARRAAASSTTP